MKIRVDDVISRTEQILHEQNASLNSRQVRALAQAIVEAVNEQLEEINPTLS